MVFAGSSQAAPTRVVLDTDLHADVDDAAALAMLHSFQDRHETRLLAVMVNTPGRFGAPCADAIDTYRGRPDVPVGALKPSDDSLAWKDYCKAIAEGFPNDLRDGARAPGAVRLYRRVLRRQPDRSVTVVSVGFMRNLAQLVLTDRKLVRRKVARLVVMGGTYPSGTEYNFEQAPWSAALVVRRWPTRIIYSGFELGGPILTGSRLFDGPLANPVRRAYELGLADGASRSSWDQTAVYYAARPRTPLFGLVRGSNTVDPGTGANAWRPDRHGRDGFLVAAAPHARIALALERLMSSTP